jgi:virulence-associated protein VapD
MLELAEESKINLKEKIDFKDLKESIKITNDEDDYYRNIKELSERIGLVNQRASVYLAAAYEEYLKGYLDLDYLFKKAEENNEDYKGKLKNYLEIVVWFRKKSLEEVLKEYEKTKSPDMFIEVIKLIKAYEIEQNFDLLDRNSQYDALLKHAKLTDNKLGEKILIEKGKKWFRSLSNQQLKIFTLSFFGFSSGNIFKNLSKLLIK